MAKYHERWTPEQIELWLATRDAILAEPELYDQWDPFRPNHKCGTAGCLMGWANVLAFPRARSLSVERTAIALGLTKQEGGAVFYGNWHDELSDKFDVAKNGKSRARVAAQYINRLLRTGTVTEDSNL